MWALILTCPVWRELLFWFQFNEPLSKNQLKLTLFPGIKLASRHVKPPQKKRREKGADEVGKS